jgi:hypothetical protein
MDATLCGVKIVVDVMQWNRSMDRLRVEQKGKNHCQKKDII